ncbi:hypothetical protein DFH08DRAFT_906338 [Mycena albidolilacea]|uniref:G-protein coupled receptors family 2 profile 2 domain-containing protein n=1 Tax=Mycena albidolilacea TaxID=1033008 RepID=A0AAD6YZB1_9AGAR|nr:hypothetical protein DFH08DRAFT_906338 [Mycena albidolilacea]
MSLYIILPALFIHLYLPPLMSSREGHLLDLINDATLGVCIPGVALSGLLLMAVAYLQRNPASRPHLNRVSFRLLVYALIANIILGVIVLTPSKEVTCSFTSFLGTASIMFSGCMSCCIALNLLFVLVYGFNGNRLEIYYILGSLLLVGACNITPWAAGELGWYAANGTCWLLGPPDVQLRWLIGTQSVWMILMSLLEVLSFVQILVFMVRHQFRIQSLRANTDTFSGNLSPTQSKSGIATLRSSLLRPPVMRYRPIIIRIGLYPLLSCLLSTTSCFADVYILTHSELTDYNIAVRILDTFAYSLRPLLYVLLAATDPSLLRALRTLRPSEHTVKTTQPWDLSVSTGSRHTVPHDLARADLDVKWNRGRREAYELQGPGKEIEITAGDEEEQMQAESIAQQI